MKKIFITTLIFLICLNFAAGIVYAEEEKKYGTTTSATDIISTEENIELFYTTVLIPCERLIYIAKGTRLYDWPNGAAYSSFYDDYVATVTGAGVFRSYGFCYAGFDYYCTVELYGNERRKIYKIVGSDGTEYYAADNGNICYSDTIYHTYGSAASSHPHYKECECGEKTSTYNSSCYTCNPAYIDYDDYYGGPGKVTVKSSSTTISSSKPTRFKYKFRGWSTDSSSTNGGYDPGDYIYLDPGETVYLYPTWEKYITMSGDYYSDSTYMEIPGTMGYFRFKPSETATYVFQSTNSSGNPRAYLYDSSENRLASNNNSNEGSNPDNFKISYQLNAGDIYYYGVKWADSSESGRIYTELRRQYNISYDTNGGSGTPSTQTKLYGNNLTLSSTIPTRTGYSFVGWDTSSTATTATYTAGASCSLNADTTLYAIWKAEGTCGNSCTWILDNAGTLTINGTGNMSDYPDASSVPWSSIRGDIKKIFVSEGITSIGNNCFNLCTNVTIVSLPSTLTSVGESSFAYTPITSFSLQEGVASIGSSAFEGCSQLTSIVLPSTLTQIGSSAFINCSQLNNVGIPSGITTISDYCFADCATLKNITIPLSVTAINDYAFCMTSVETISYAGSPTHWNKIAIGVENTSLASATKTYEVEDFTVTYAVTTNGAATANKTSEQVPNGEKADLSIVAKRETLPGGGPMGTEKYIPWEFLGWNTDQNATVALEEVIVTSDVTLYPIFKKELTYNFYHANNELLESKTITIYNADNAAKFTMPSIDAYLDWEPVEWCNDEYYSEMSDPVKMFDINAEVGLQFSCDFYARYKRTTTLTYDVGDYSGSFNPYTFVQYYYGSGQKTSETVFMPEVLSRPTGEPLFYGWAKGSTDGDVFQSGDRMTVDEDTTMYALWQERATTPTISVADNNGMKRVSMSCSMDGAKIYYTTDGTIPTPESNMYTVPITITGNEDMLFKAIAVKDGYAYSKTIAKDVILNTVDIPISSILPGYIKMNSVVTLSAVTSGATIYYTTDGSVPTRESNVYSSPFTITETTEICTLAVKDGMKDSSATMFKYIVIDGSTPYITMETTQNSDNTLTVTVNITENSKAAGGSFNLIYDNSALEIVDASKGNYIKYANPYIKKDYRDNSIRVVWAGVEELDGGGEILTATFNLLSTSKEQTLLSIEKAKLSDADANKLTVQSSDAIVLLSNNTQYFDEYKTETTVGTDKKSLVVNLVERADKNGCIITVVYNSDGRLVQWKPTDVVTGKDTYTIPLDTALESKQKIKVFVWSSLNILKPISNKEEFIYE